MNRPNQELADHHPWLRRLARRLARTSARADDLVQETCITALTHAPPGVQLRPWLRAVMRKLAWGQHRSERRRERREHGYSLAQPAFHVPEALAAHGIDRDQLAAALARLPEPFKSTVVQRFVEGQSCAEIARRERVPAGTVRWRQARALELLRADLLEAPRRRRTSLWLVPVLGAKLAHTLVTPFLGWPGARLWLACVALACAAVGVSQRGFRDLVAEGATPVAFLAGVADDGARAAEKAAIAPIESEVDVRNGVSHAAITPATAASVRTAVDADAAAPIEATDAVAATADIGLQLGAAAFLYAAPRTPRLAAARSSAGSSGSSAVPPPAAQEPEPPPEPPPAEPDCHSAITEAGLVCTSCAGDTGAPECLPAECHVVDRCLRCVDPRGRVAHDCTIDYETYRGAGTFTISADATYMSSCELAYGIPHVSGTTCHFPGVESCEVTDSDGWTCLACHFPGGAGVQVCGSDADSLPDPMLGRPLDLPAPGTCAHELDADGEVVCTTCTREDLSATTSCRYAGLATCDFQCQDGSDPDCLGECQKVDGGRVGVRNSRFGPRPDEPAAE